MVREVRKIDRRDFLRLGTAAAVGGAGLTIAACANASSGSSGISTVGSKTLPKFIQRQVVKPDFPGNSAIGLPDAYVAYPANPPKSWTKGTPAHGGTITVLKEIDGAPPTPLSSNPWWQELNKRVGATIQPTNVAEADMATKLATVVAGGNDLPDLVQMNLQVPNVPGVLSHEFQDLSEWLSGSAIKDYPNLAALPTVSWENVAINGGIWGIPWPLGIIGGDLRVRQDIFDELSLPGDVPDGRSFMDMLKTLTNPGQHRWALDKISSAMSIVGEMVGTPNVWKVQGGKFTSYYTTDEYKNMLDLVRQIWKAGYIYPNSLASTTAFHQWFESGLVAMSYDGYTNWSELMPQGVQIDPKYRMGGLITHMWNGGAQTSHHAGSGIYTFTSLKKTNKARVKELLTVLDWFASPFGSEEYLFKGFGIAGQDYTLQGTDPVGTEAGVNNVTNMNIGYLSDPTIPVYNPGFKDVTKAQYAYYKKLTQFMTPLPTVGLYSPTNSTKGAAIGTTLTSLATDIIVGRQPLSAGDAGVQTWRSGGGDQIAKEYEQALEKKNKKG